MTDHRENDVAGSSEFGGRIGETCALGLKRKSLGGVASVDCEGVAGGEEARGHGSTHYAYADPSDAGSGRVDGVWVRSPHGSREGDDSEDSESWEGQRRVTRAFTVGSLCTELRNY